VSEAIDLLTELAAIPSPSGHEREAAAFLADWLRARGCDATVDEAGNAVGVKGSGDREILLLGHIDTVPGQIPVRREGELLYGRGVVDAKGPLAVFAAAAAQVDAPHGWRVTVVGAVEEECATSRGARFVLSQRSRPPACCVIGEPSRWDRITLGYRGRLLLDLELRAPLAHSAGGAPSPAERAVDLWQRLHEECTAYNREHAARGVFDSLDASLRSIASREEERHGVVRMRCGFRLPLSLTPEVLRSRLDRLTAEATASGEDGCAGAERRETPGSVEVSRRYSGAERAFRSGKANPLVRAFLGAIRRAGGAPRFVVKAGTSDMNVVGTHWPELPIVAYGPGDSALDHTPDEHVDAGEIARSVDVLTDVLQSVMAAGPPGAGRR